MTPTGPENDFELVCVCERERDLDTHTHTLGDLGAAVALNVVTVDLSSKCQAALQRRHQFSD